LVIASNTTPPGGSKEHPMIVLFPVLVTSRGIVIVSRDVVALSNLFIQYSGNGSWCGMN